MPISLIRTARLTLRRPVAADAESIFGRYASDPRVTRFMAWPTHRTIEDTRGYLAYCDAQWEGAPAANYVIVRTADNLLLGGTGLEFETTIRAETGYVLAQDAWGQGYATEALAAMISLARSLGVLELTAGVHPHHQPSIRVLEKGRFHLRNRQDGNARFPNLDAALPRDRLIYGRAP